MTRPILLALVAMLALAATASAASTGDSYLNNDGSLAAQPSPPSQACLSLTAMGPASATKAFTGTIANGTFHLEPQTASLLLALAPNPTSGTGFTLQGELDVAGQTASDTITVASGASVPSPLRLAFPLDSANGTGPMGLTLTLTKTSAGPLALGHAIGILCGNDGSRLGGITYTQDGQAQHADDEDDHGEGTALSTPAVLGLALLAGLVTLLAGALAISGRTVSPRRIHLLLGATAGLLLAIAILDLVPEAVELNEDAPYTIIAGLLVLFLVRHFAGEHSHGGHDHDDEPGSESQEQHHKHAVATHAAGLAVITFFALGFHRFVDGLVLPAAFELDSAVGFAAASAVLIHQFPDGIAAASLFLAAGWRRKKVLLGILIMALLTPIGSIAGLSLLGREALVGHLIALAAATFIFIPLAELLPELRAKEHRWPVGVGFVAGYIVAIAIVFVPGLLGFGHH